MLSFTPPPFVLGIDLNRMFFQQVVKPLIDKHFPGLRYSAGLLGEGSDVMRCDTPQSMDHNWGPHVRIFLTEADFKEKKDELDNMLRKKLPYEFMGFPTNFTKPNEDTYLVQQMKPIKSGEVNHLVEFYTIKSFWAHYLGYNPYKKISYKDWLLFPQQALIEITEGEVYYDGLEELNKIREKFRYYPDDIWRYIYALQWGYLGNQEAYMGRTGEVGDELGSNIIANQLVMHIMRLCFMMEKKYMPYSKWFGTAFSRLKCGGELTNLLINTVHGNTWQEREEHLGGVYEILLRMHNNLKVTKPLDLEVSEYEGRPYKVLHAMKIYKAVRATWTPRFERMKYILGSLDQFIGHTRIQHMNYVYWEMKKVIR
jgi:hypothetical protein